MKPRDIQDLASDYGTYLEYHRGVSKLRRALEAGAPVPVAVQRKLLRNGPKAEALLKKSLVTALETMNDNEDLFFGASGAMKAIRKHQSVLRAGSDPAVLSSKVRQAITKNGITLHEYSRYFNVLFGKTNGPHLKRCLDGLGRDIKKVTRQTQDWVQGSRFPESESELRKRGLITISGGDNPVPYIIGGAAVVVGVGIIVATGGLAAGVVPGVIAIATGSASFGTMIGASIAVAGATLLATEAYQDLTGTQDDRWEFIAKYKGSFDLSVLT